MVTRYILSVAAREALSSLSSLESTESSDPVFSALDRAVTMPTVKPSSGR